MTDTLISRDNKGKCRVIIIECIFIESENIYEIKRSSGLLGGKFIEQPTLIISKGKAKRTLQEQTALEYNSAIKKYLDKGYKNTRDLGLTSLTQEAIDKVLPLTNTDQNGVWKPQLCKILDKTKSQLINKNWLASYKLDGVRCLIYFKDGEVHTASRGGQDYDIPATYIRQDPYLIKVLSENNVILDGEIYRHGWPLSKISGLCRKETLENDHKELEFRCYDILDEKTKFKFRAISLGQIKNERPIDSKLVIVDHIPVSGLNNIMQLHNKAVSEGYEGLVLRDPEKEYKCGSRDNRMCKVKEFVDSEFEILGLVEGLRDEDMCFLLKTSEGNQFKAKPMGTREDKQWYREHINELIGCLGTVKYFGFTNTENPVPNLPVFKSVRLTEDL